MRLLEKIELRPPSALSRGGHILPSVKPISTGGLQREEPTRRASRKGKQGNTINIGRFSAFLRWWSDKMQPIQPCPSSPKLIDYLHMSSKVNSIPAKTSGCKKKKKKKQLKNTLQQRP